MPVSDSDNYKFDQGALHMVLVRLQLFGLSCLFDRRFLQLLDVLNSHFQTVFGITKLQSTLLQLAYFVSKTMGNTPIRS